VSACSRACAPVASASTRRQSGETLRFRCYFTEDIPEFDNLRDSMTCSQRVRKFSLLFYTQVGGACFLSASLLCVCACARAYVAPPPAASFSATQDSSVALNEIKVNNSGLLQGRFLKRSRVTKDNKGTLFAPLDFRIGADLPTA
jgi:hypothetical protein